jgi:hypothetical protein
MDVDDYSYQYLEICSADDSPITVKDFDVRVHTHLNDYKYGILNNRDKSSAIPCNQTTLFFT